jgi:hypothetical protein
MLGVTTLQVGDPVALVVLMEAYDSPGHFRDLGVIRGGGSRQ